MLRQTSQQGLLQGPAVQHQAGSAEEELWLLGQPPLRDYLDFIEHQSLDGASAAREPSGGDQRGTSVEPERSLEGVRDP